MTLMQISEPGQSVAKQACRLPAIGIDLGTTNSVVACVRDGQAEILCPPEQQALIPSVVRYLSDGSVVVGEQAQQSSSEFPADTIASVKRFVGRGNERYGCIGQAHAI